LPKVEADFIVLEFLARQSILISSCFWNKTQKAQTSWISSLDYLFTSWFQGQLEFYTSKPLSNFSCLIQSLNLNY